MGKNSVQAQQCIEKDSVLRDDWLSTETIYYLVVIGLKYSYFLSTIKIVITYFSSGVTENNINHSPHVLTHSQTLT